MSVQTIPASALSILVAAIAVELATAPPVPLVKPCAVCSKAAVTVLVFNEGARPMRACVGCTRFMMRTYSSVRIVCDPYAGHELSVGAYGAADMTGDRYAYLGA